MTVDLQYAPMLAPSPQIRFARNGMGDPRVWHGFSDSCLNTEHVSPFHGIVKQKSMNVQ